MKGRPPKPTVMHIADGTYEPAKHGGKLQADGKPIKPPGLDATSSESWDWLVRILDEMNVLAEADTFAMEKLCRLWSQWRIVMSDFERDTTDRNARLSVCSLGKEVDQLLQQFGLTPAARARINQRPDKPKTVGRRQRTA